MPGIDRRLWFVDDVMQHGRPVNAAAPRWLRATMARGAVVLVSLVAVTGCGQQDTSATTASANSTSATPTSNDADQRALRNLYTQLVDALGHHDTAGQVALTCTRYQGEVQRRADQDPMLKIDYLGSADDVRRLGPDAATDKLHATLQPASRQAVAAVVDAIIEGSAEHYQAAIKRVEREGTVATLDKIDDITIVGDTATVDGAYTMRVFTLPPQVVAGTNQAVRENGQWKDCTPPTR